MQNEYQDEQSTSERSDQQWMPNSGSIGTLSQSQVIATKWIPRLLEYDHINLLVHFGTASFLGGIDQCDCA